MLHTDSFGNDMEVEYRDYFHEDVFEILIGLFILAFDSNMNCNERV